MKLSIAVPPGPQSRALAVRAEELGYDRIWFYDSAGLYEDIWIHLALVAEATERIGLGTGVMVPNLRHVMTTASAIATIERLAPGRLACAVGTGYTARVVLGQKALPWKTVRTYVEQLRALLRGEVVEIEGRPCQMIHRPEYAKARPIEVPFVLSAFGPKGLAISQEIADGWMGFSPPAAHFDWAIQMVNGTVLAPGESANAARVVDAVGPWQVGAYHLTWEAARENLPAIPGGADWLAQIESERPADARHLAVHHSHCTHLSTADRKALAAFGDAIPWSGWVGEKDAILARGEAAAAAGTTEILYTPAGDDLIGQIETFYDALAPVQGAGAS
ncbi:MAG: LLM class flavin-dependent oxidoreductase [Myxococcota bacterium]